MAYDYTRIKLGDHVRDDQTLDEGKVVDMQMVGQWIVLITVLWQSNNIRQELTGILEGAPAVVDVVKEITGGIRRNVFPGEEVRANLSQAAGGTRVSVVYSPPAESPTIQKEVKTKPGLDKLREKIEKETGKSIEIEGRTVSKAKLLQTITDIQSSSAGKNAFKRMVGPRELTLAQQTGQWEGLVTLVHGQILQGKGVNPEDVKDVLRYMAQNKREVWSSAEIIVANASRGSAGSAGAARAEARDTTLRSALIRDRGALNSVLLQNRIPDPLNLTDTYWSGRGPEEFEDFLRKTFNLRGYDSDVYQHEVIDPIMDSLRRERMHRKVIDRAIGQLSPIDRVWDSVSGSLYGRSYRVAGETRYTAGVIDNIVNGLNVARFYGFADDSLIPAVHELLQDAGTRGRQGAAQFQQVRRLVTPIRDRLVRAAEAARGGDDAVVALETKLNVAQRVRMDLESGTQLDSNDIMTAQLERNAAFEEAQGHTLSSRQVSDSLAHERAILNKIDLTGHDLETPKVISQVQELRKSLEFGNQEDLPWQGRLVRITEAGINDAGKGYLKGVPAPTRVLDLAGFSLPTNIKLNGRDPAEVFRTTLTDILASRLEDDDSPLRSTAPTTFNITGPSAELSAAARDMYRKKQPLSAAGRSFGSLEELLAAAYGTDPTQAALDFNKQVRRSALARVNRRVTKNIRTGQSKLAEGIFEQEDEFLGEVVLSYTRNISKSTAADIKLAHRAALGQAIEDALQAKLPGFRAKEFVSLDDAQKELERDLILGPEAALMDKEMARQRMLRVIMRGQMGMSGDQIEALLSGEGIRDVPRDVIIQRLKSAGIIPKSKAKLEQLGVTTFEIVNDFLALGHNPRALNYLDPKFEEAARALYGEQIWLAAPRRYRNRLRWLMDERHPERVTAAYQALPKRAAEELAEHIINKSGIFANIETGGKSSMGTIANLIPEETLNKLVAEFSGVNVGQAADGTLTIGLSKASAKQLLNAVGTGEVNSGFLGLMLDKLARRSDITIAGAPQASIQVLHGNRTFTVASPTELVDEAGFYFHTDPDSVILLPARAALTQRVMVDPSLRALDEYAASLGDVFKFFELPGHGGSRMNLISTSDSVESFLGQIENLKAASSGQFNKIHFVDIEASPAGIFDVGIGISEPVMVDGTVQYQLKSVKSIIYTDRALEYDRGHLAKMEKVIKDYQDNYGITPEIVRLTGDAHEAEKQLIGELMDHLRGISPDQALSTHYKPYEFRRLIERARALGMDDQAALLEQIAAGTGDATKYIDTMVAAQVADPNMPSFAVQKASRTLRIRPHDYIEPHVGIGDIPAQVDLLNAGITRGAENINYLAGQQPKDLTGQYLWGAQGDQMGRLFRVEGFVETEDMKAKAQIGILLREVELDASGKAVLGQHTVMETHAGHYLGKTISGKYTSVTEAEGVRLLSDYVPDLAQRNIRRMMTSASLPFVEAQRLRIAREGLSSIPELSAKDQQVLTDYLMGGGTDFSSFAEGVREKIESVVAAAGQGDWFRKYGQDWRRRAQLTGVEADWLDGEFAAVHKPFYEFVRGLGLSDKEEQALLTYWDTETTKILGARKQVTGYTPPSSALGLTVDIPGVGSRMVRIGSPELMEGSIRGIAEQYAAHMDPGELTQVAGKYASTEEIKAFFAAGQDMSKLPYTAQDAITAWVKNSVIFNAFQSSRSDFTNRALSTVASEKLNQALASPEGLYGFLNEVGQDPGLVNRELEEILTQREFTDYTSRVTPSTITREQSRQVQELLDGIKANYKTLIPGLPESNRFPFEGVVKNMRGKTVDETIAEYVKSYVSRVGEIFDTVEEAQTAGRRAAKNALAGVFSDEDIYNKLQGPLQSDLLNFFGFSSYDTEAAAEFRDERMGRSAPQWAREQVAREDISRRIEDAQALEDLVGVPHPTTLDGDISASSVQDLRNMSRNWRLSQEARSRLADFAEELSANVAGGLRSGLGASEAFTAAAVSTKHAVVQQSIESAADYLSSTVKVPSVRVGAAAIGVAAALFLGRKPNLEPEEANMTPKQRFERSINNSEKPLYFRIYARITGAVDSASGASEGDLVQGAKEALAMHLNPNGVEHADHTSQDSRKRFSQRVLDNLSERMLRAAYPINDPD